MASSNTKQLERWIQAACLLECLSPKAGNVHPGARFENLAVDDFLYSAGLVAPILAESHQRGVSQTILESVSVTSREVGQNTNLGIVLLLAPLAAVPLSVSIREGIAQVIDSLDVADTERIYEAIRIAEPGGMREVEEQDLASAPSLPVRAVMELAQDYDLNARQYANNFQDVIEFGLSALQDCLVEQSDVLPAIQRLHLKWMAQYPDSLIGRKCGPEVAEESAERAGHVLAAGTQAAFDQFDRWLRAEGNRRNPGTSADLVAASLFLGFREGILSLDRMTPLIKRELKQIERDEMI